MARRVTIADFADKLTLALGRANLSRAALAQVVGVDKSVVARWAAGALHPADHSLAALSAALGRAIPGFDRTAWDLPVGDFARRLGITSAVVATPREVPTDLLLPLLHGADQSAAAAGCTGLWARLFVSVRGLGRLLCFITRISAPADARALRIETGDVGTVLWHGSLIAFGPWLYAAQQATHRDDLVGFWVLTGVDRGHAAIMEALNATRDGGPEGAAAAVPFLLLRLADRGDDAAFLAARHIATERNRRGGWEEVLPAPLLARFRLPPAGPATPSILRRSTADSWAMREEDLEDPSMADRRAAIEAMRHIFAAAIATPA